MPDALYVAHARCCQMLMSIHYDSICSSWVAAHMICQFRVPNLDCIVPNLDSIVPNLDSIVPNLDGISEMVFKGIIGTRLVPKRMGFNLE